MEDFKNLPIFKQFININETAQTIKSNNPIEEKLIKQFSDELKSKIDYLNLIENFEGISKKLIIMGIKPKIVMNSFLVYKYTNIDNAIEFLCKNQEGEYNHKFIPSDGNKCFICEEEEKNHRCINKIYLKSNLNEISDLEEDYKLKKKISEKENFLRKSLNSNTLKNRDSIISVKKNILEIEKEELKINPSDKNECPICILEITDNMNFELICNHRFCLDCVREYLNEEIKNSRVLKLKCPEKNCNAEFDERKIRLLTKDEVFYKYKKFLLREKYKYVPNIVCCPIVNCEGYASKSDEVIKIDDKPQQKLIESQLKIESKKFIKF